MFKLQNIKDSKAHHFFFYIQWKSTKPQLLFQKRKEVFTKWILPTPECFIQKKIQKKHSNHNEEKSSKTTYPRYLRAYSYNKVESLCPFI